MVDNGEKEAVIQTANTNIRTDIDIYVSATSTNKRAYVIEVEAKVSGTWVPVDSISNLSAGALPDHEYLGFGQLVWVEDSEMDRNIMLDVSSSGAPTEYRVTVSKPDMAFTKPLTFSTSTVQNVELTTTVLNSSRKSYAYRYDLYCLDPDVDGALSSADSISTLNSGRFTEVSLTTVCEGVDLTDNSFDVTMIMLTQKCSLLSCSPVERAISAEVVVDWTLDTNTLWHSRNPLIGGLQASARSAGDDIPGLCTLSFPLTLVPLSEGAEKRAVSTTGHCVDADYLWLQGPVPLVSSNSGVASIGNTFLPRKAAESSCTIGNTQVSNCRSGDQAYATSTVQGSVQIFRAKQRRAEEDAISLNHFAKTSTGSPFTIIASRPPAQGDEVNKVGRTTGWSFAEVEWTSGTSSDPACPGDPLSTRDNLIEGNYQKCVTRTGYVSEGGDSGSPVFTRVPRSSDKVFLVGVHYGYRSPNKVFIPIDRSIWSRWNADTTGSPRHCALCLWWTSRTMTDRKTCTWVTWMGNRSSRLNSTPRTLAARYCTTRPLCSETAAE